MFDSREELLQEICLGDDTSLELNTVRFRESRVAEPKRDDLADDLAAIANTHDGVLVLGVDDKTRDIGGILVDRLEAVERYVYEICNESIKPPVLFRSCDRANGPPPYPGRYKGERTGHTPRFIYARSTGSGHIDV